MNFHNDSINRVLTRFQTRGNPLAACTAVQQTLDSIRRRHKSAKHASKPALMAAMLLNSEICIVCTIAVVSFGYEARFRQRRLASSACLGRRYVQNRHFQKPRERPSHVADDQSRWRPASRPLRAWRPEQSRLRLSLRTLRRLERRASRSSPYLGSFRRKLHNGGAPRNGPFPSATATASAPPWSG